MRVCSLNGQFVLKHLKPQTCFGIREWALLFSLSNYPYDWTDVCTYFNSSLLFPPCLSSVSFADTDMCTNTLTKCSCTLGYAWTLIWPITLTFPNVETIQKPLTVNVTPPPFSALWRDIQHAPLTPLMGQFCFKWACFASTHFFLHIFQDCGFYWSLSSQECWCLDCGTRQQLVGLLMVVSPAGCSVLGFEWCQAQQLPCSPTALSEDAC